MQINERNFMQNRKRNIAIFIAILLTGVTAFFIIDDYGRRKEKTSDGVPVPVPRIGRSAYFGDVNAKYKTAIFSDFTCAYCKQFFEQEFTNVLKKQVDSGEVLFIWKDVSSPKTKDEQPSSVFLAAAQKQNKAFEALELLFSNGRKISEAEFPQMAIKLNMDTLQMREFISDKQNIAEIQADYAYAQTCKIQGTPSFVINGMLYSGYLSADEFYTLCKKPLPESMPDKRMKMNSGSVK
jgi:protein-disulfide isomerase